MLKARVAHLDKVSVGFDFIRVGTLIGFSNRQNLWAVKEPKVRILAYVMNLPTYRLRELIAGCQGVIFALVQVLLEGCRHLLRQIRKYIVLLQILRQGGNCLSLVLP